MSGQAVAKFNGALYAAPYVKNNMSETAQEAMGRFFGGNSPEIQFQPSPIDEKTGPTTAFSTTVEARRWDHVINSYLIMEKMHEHQEFPLLLAPLELAKGMKFTTRIFTSNLDPPEEAPEHVPAPFSTTQWSETTTALRMVHRSVKFSLHELKTTKGQQDYKVHLSNLALMFLRDTHNVILRKFARQTTLVQALTSFFPASDRMNRELMHTIVRNFGSLNTSVAGLDALVANVKQVGVTQNVDFDTCVVPYGSLSNMALSQNNFILTETAVTLARDLAKMADINQAAKIPTHVFQNNFNVFQYQKNADQIQNPANDPLANSAVVATYHPFGSSDFYKPGSRDIQVISAQQNGWATLKFEDAVNNLDIAQDENSECYGFTPDATAANSGRGTPTTDRTDAVQDSNMLIYGDDSKLWANFSAVNTLKTQLNGFTTEELYNLIYNSCVPIGAGQTFIGKISDDKTKRQSFFNKVHSMCPQGFGEFYDQRAMYNFDDTICYKLALFACIPFCKNYIKKHLGMGINFPYEVAAVRPFIELETANALFSKRGRETAVTYCLPPWTFVGRDNRIEMVDMKFGFWRECHIERPANILVAEHAFVTRVKGGMNTTWMSEAAYINNPMAAKNTADVYPVITGPLCSNQIHPNMTAISHKVVDTSVRDTYQTLSLELEPTFQDLRAMNDVWKETMTISPTLWNRDTLVAGSIPRLCALGTTRQMELELSANNQVQRIKPSSTIIKNKGHMKELDSEELIGSLSGFAQTHIAAPRTFF